MTHLATLLLAAALAPAPDPAAIGLLDSAIARMGGAAALRGVERVRLELMTQWLRPSFDDRPFADYPSYERHSDLRDYPRGAWRNTRQFGFGATPRYVTDVVLDDAAIRDLGTGFAPLNVAYVDERRELFTLTPDRAVLLFRDAADLKLLPDSALAGVPHARVRATVSGMPAVLFLRRSDALPALLRYRAAQVNDFGLTQWGEMDVEVWYSNWVTYRDGISLPTQWDVLRVGKPYKRMTVLAATFNAAAPADSFPVTDALRAAFRATATRPMHDVPLDSARALEARVVTFNSPWGAPAGAVKLGSGWLLLEAGRAPLNAARALAWLRAHDAGARVEAAVVTSPFPGNGGAGTLTRERIPVHAGPLAEPVLRRVLSSQHATAAMHALVRPVPAGRWVRISTDSAWVEPIDLPNARGALLVYVPSLEWLYASHAASPLEVNLLFERAGRRGWRVSRYGNARALLLPRP